MPFLSPSRQRQSTESRFPADIRTYHNIAFLLLAATTARKSDSGRATLPVRAPHQAENCAALQAQVSLAGSLPVE